MTELPLRWHHARGGATAGGRSSATTATPQRHHSLSSSATRYGSLTNNPVLRRAVEFGHGTSSRRCATRTHKQKGPRGAEEGRARTACAGTPRCNQQRPLAAAPGPDATRASVNRGVELCGEVVDSPQAVITMQVSVLAARPSSVIARPSGVGLPPPCRTRSSRWSGWCRSRAIRGLAGCRPSARRAASG